MTSRVDPSLLPALREYGHVNIDACFNCGNCTAICPLSTDETPFPRSNIRMLQLGLKDRLLQSVDPWLCYYCGECSDTCPRQAEPGEAQMATRRWLTAQYDWTGLASRFYTSAVWEIAAIVIVGLFIALLLALFHGPIVTHHVELNTFAPPQVIHYGDWIMAAALSFFLLSNVYRMHHLILVRGAGGAIPPSLYVTEAWRLLYHFATQPRFSQCGRRMRWVNHLILVAGYVLMFILIMGLLLWFQTDEIYPIYHPQRWLGYLAAAAILWGSGTALWGRLKKRDQMHRFSQLSDWVFPILLILTALTGILVHVFRYLGLPTATYSTYVLHLAIAVPMLVLEVPFGKWSHLAYRPFAIYFQAIREKAPARQAADAATPAPA
jgi:quinone-modifying oxidoreductase subunit QmoC